MKIAVIFVALVGIVLSEPVQLQYGDCERLNMDSTITVTVSKGDMKDSATVVSYPSDLAVSSGSCNGTSRSFVVYFNKTMTKLTFTFTLDENDTVTAMPLVQIITKALFPEKNYSQPTAFLNEPMELSSSNNSYKCEAEQTIKFPQVNVSGFLYDVTLMMKNMQVQAFNLPADGFSEATECEQDEVTTLDPSTADMTTAEASTSEEASTTEKPTEDTTQAETTQAVTTTEAPTTTEEPKADNVTYEVKEDNTTCIKMVAAIVVSVTYETTDNKTETKQFAVPTSATAEGSCGNGTESNATLTIKYENDTIEFMFEDKNKLSMIASVMLTVELDASRFPNAKDAGMKMNMTSNTPTGETDDVNYYTCIVGTQVKFDSGMLDISQLKVQAFNLKDGDFSNKGMDCSADASTTASPTPTISTTPKPEPSGPPINNFNVSSDNGTCLMMRASLVLDIKYMDKDGNSQLVEVAIPEGVEFSGECKETVETLMIKPFQDWMIEMTFSGADSLEANELAADSDYQLTNLTVTYKFDERLPNANKTGQTATVTTSVDKFKAPVDGSYKCNANVTITMNDDVKLMTSNFRYQAFQGNNTAFNDKDLQECNADIETNSIVPIAVGAALAGLVVIVLIAYLIGRRKSRRQGYESV